MAFLVACLIVHCRIIRSRGSVLATYGTFNSVVYIRAALLCDPVQRLWLVIYWKSLAVTRIVEDLLTS
jgi:hypothetical protein